jgi:hypothetical protein
MWIDSRFLRLRNVLCSTAYAVAPITSIIFGVPMIGHSLASALCPPPGQANDSSIQRKTNAAEAD